MVEIEIGELRDRVDEIPDGPSSSSAPTARARPRRFAFSATGHQGALPRRGMSWRARAE